MQGHIALLAAEERLVVLLALVGALLAVPPLGGALAVELSRHDPVIEAVVSGLIGGAAAHPLPDGQHPIPPEQFQDQLPQEGQEGLPVAGDLQNKRYDTTFSKK